jgi:hypothetical protein
LYDSDGATYNITDTSNRGSGSDSVDTSSLYKVKPAQAAAIRDFIKFANSSQGAAKVPPSYLNTFHPSARIFNSLNATLFL